MTSIGPEEKDKLKVETDRITSDIQYANQIDPTYGISHFQLHALKLLSTNDKYELREDQKALARRFINEAMGNMELNENLRTIKLMDLSKTGINPEVIKNLFYFSFKSRSIKDFPSIVEKLIKNQNRIDNGMDLDEAHKITLGEYSIFSDIIKVKPMFDFFQKKVDYKIGADGYNLSKNINKGAEVATKMEAASKDNIKDTTGMITFNDPKKTGKLSLFEAFIRKYITKRSHAGKLYSNKKEEMIISHINPFPSDDKFQLRDFLYTDVYQIKIDKLISNKNQDELKKLYGEDWKLKINELYSAIERKIHDGTVTEFQFLRSQTPTGKNIAGFANLFPVFLANKKIRETDFSKIHRSVMQKHYKQTHGNMLCSEFVAITTIATMMELNKQIKKAAEEKGIELSDCIDIPFSKHENLHNMMPDRLLSVLTKKGCIEKIKKTDDVKRYFVKKK